VAGQAVDAVANPAYQFGEVSLVFWLICGLGMAVARIAPAPAVEEAEETSAERPQRRLLPRLAWQGAMVSLVGTVLLSGFALGQDFLPAEPIYSQITLFTLTARSGSTNQQIKYAQPTVQAGECIELQLALQFLGSNVYQAERSPFITYTIGGTAPAGCVVQQPAPDINVFCVPANAAAECNGKTVDLTATYNFKGQPVSRTVSFNILGAGCGVQASVDRPVLPATGNFETVNVTFVNAPTGLKAPLLKRVDIYPDVFLNRTGDAIPNADASQIQLKAVAGRTYVLLYKTCDAFNRPCYIRLVVLVSSRTAFETATEAPKG